MSIATVAVASLAMQGSLFGYNASKPHLVAFASGPMESGQAVVLLPGLTEGPLALPWSNRLGEAAGKRGWGLVQPVLSSSYVGFGSGTLDRDLDELDNLVAVLGEKHGIRRVVLVGHSTGSQQSLYFARFAKQRALLAGCVLQAAASDREYYVDSMPDHNRWIQLARQRKAQGEGEEMMPRRSYTFAPVTVNRFLSLNDVGGEDDMFSSDLKPNQLAAIYAPVKVPLAMIQSAQDQYIPKSVQPANLLALHKAAYPNYRTMAVIENADHAVTPVPAQRILIHTIMKFMATLGNGKRR